MAALKNDTCFSFFRVNSQYQGKKFKKPLVSGTNPKIPSVMLFLYL